LLHILVGQETQLTHFLLPQMVVVALMVELVLLVKLAVLVVLTVAVEVAGHQILLGQVPIMVVVVLGQPTTALAEVLVAVVLVVPHTKVALRVLPTQVVAVEAVDLYLVAVAVRGHLEKLLSNIQILLLPQTQPLVLQQFPLLVVLEHTHLMAPAR
jgi:hypothetical protein